jgi:hypothetical protein
MSPRRLPCFRPATPRWALTSTPPRCALSLSGRAKVPLPESVHDKDSALAPNPFRILVVATAITLIGLCGAGTDGPELSTIIASIATLMGAAIFAVTIWTERRRG